MSDLKYKKLHELAFAKDECEKYISQLKSKLNGQEQRLEWIKKYIYEKTPKEMTIKQIESVLGHKVIISN